MNARSLVSAHFPGVSSLRIGFPSKRALFNFAQIAMVMGYLSAIVHPFDGDAMLLGLVCQMAALWLYVMSRDDAKTPPSA